MSQQDRIVLKLREMILNGVLAPGERVLEVALAESLQASRTPIRRAIKILESEGLLVVNGTRGYQVRTFSFDDIVHAIEVRGVLEGLAARLVARRGLTPESIAQFEHCLQVGARLIEKTELVSGDEEIFATMNVLFHDTLTGAAGNKALSNALAINDRLPFAAAGAVAINVNARGTMAQQMHLLTSAQMDHQMIYQALRQRQGARAESLVREHAYLAVQNMRLVSASGGIADAPGTINRFDGDGL
ncbi:MAG: GntR family transcriptional regulator [Pseudomonadota bacterium]